MLSIALHLIGLLVCIIALIRIKPTKSEICVSLLLAVVAFGLGWFTC